MFFHCKETTYFQIGFRDYSILESVHEMIGQRNPAKKEWNKEIFLKKQMEVSLKLSVNQF